tara:strand:+ start:90 stop:470 length:381 start_codon:yes stop_codon:yes gene_type:complete
MPGYGAALPLRSGTRDGISLLATVGETIKQNLKMLVLTSPGERMWDPNFGVGMRNYLFEPLATSTMGKIDARIKSQVKKYLPYVLIDSIKFDSSFTSPNEFSNYLGIEIVYKIKGISGTDILTVAS